MVCKQGLYGCRGANGMEYNNNSQSESQVKQL